MKDRYPGSGGNGRRPTPVVGMMAHLRACCALNWTSAEHYGTGKRAAGPYDCRLSRLFRQLAVRLIVFVFLLTFSMALFVPFSSSQAAKENFAEGIRAFRNAEFDRARNVLEVLAEKGETEAQTLLGSLLCDGIYLPKNTPRCVDLIRQAAEKGNTDAQYRLGIMYLRGNEEFPGIKQDLDTGYSWLERSSDKSNPRAQFQLASKYLSLKAFLLSINEHPNLSTSKDYLEGEIWRYRTITANFVVSQINIKPTVFHLQNKSEEEIKSAQHNLEKARSLLETSALQGYGQAINSFLALRRTVIVQSSPK